MILKSLFSPGLICNMGLKNRVVLPPMATALCEPGGVVSKKLVDFHIARVKGGCGLNIVELAAVHPSTIGKGKFGIGIFDDKFIPGLKELSLAIKIGGGMPAIQLWHAGRQINSQDVITDYIVAPSAIPCPVCKEKPKELTIFEIEELIDSFGDAALRAKEAGFEAVEVHGAHGYLICQFLSSYSNKRDDKYGGSMENRARFAVEIVKNIKAKTGYRFPLLFRLSSEEYVEGGIDIKQAIQISRILESSGVDALHISAGNYESLHYIVPPLDVPVAFNVKRAAAIKEVVSIPVIVAGRINDPLLADKIISDDQADFVSIGRGQLADPDFCIKALNDDFDSILKCIACNQGCIDRVLFEKEDISCLLNPACGREKEFTFKPAKKQLKVLVAGGGPGGLEAAKLLSSAGHKVILCEKSSSFGGQFALAGIVPGKDAVSDAVLKMRDLAKKAGALLMMTTEVDQRVIEEIKPDIMIIATGSNPFIQDISANDNNGKFVDASYSGNIVTAHDILKGVKNVKQNVAIIGGGITGIETAKFLATQGKKVMVMEIHNEIARDLDPLSRPFLLEKIKKLGIFIYTNTKFISINGSSIEVETEGHRRSFDGIESVVFACGVKPESDLKEIFKNSNLQYYVIGDANRPGNALDAIWAAADLTLKICNANSEREPEPEIFSKETISDLTAEITRQIKLKLNI
jgi:2,4-dienoyl-CoA reductase-like NADH-dependent reductase (Old Yellow Enzyme family)/thioredoxin reductase